MPSGFSNISFFKAPLRWGWRRKGQYNRSHIFILEVSYLFNLKVWRNKSVSSCKAPHCMHHESGTLLWVQGWGHKHCCVQPVYQPQEWDPTQSCSASGRNAQSCWESFWLTLSCWDAACCRFISPWLLLIQSIYPSLQQEQKFKIVYIFYEQYFECFLIKQEKKAADSNALC